MGAASVTFNMSDKSITRGFVAWTPASAEKPLLELDYARKTLTLDGVRVTFLDLEVLTNRIQYCTTV